MSHYYQTNRFRYQLASSLFHPTSETTCKTSLRPTPIYQSFGPNTYMHGGTARPTPSLATVPYPSRVTVRPSITSQSSPRTTEYATTFASTQSTVDSPNLRYPENCSFVHHERDSLKMFSLKKTPVPDRRKRTGTPLHSNHPRKTRRVHDANSPSRRQIDKIGMFDFSDDKSIPDSAILPSAAGMFQSGYCEPPSATGCHERSWNTQKSRDGNSYLQETCEEPWKARCKPQQGFPFKNTTLDPICISDSDDEAVGQRNQSSTDSLEKFTSSSDTDTTYQVPVRNGMKSSQIPAISGVPTTCFRKQASPIGRSGNFCLSQVNRQGASQPRRLEYGHMFQDKSTSPEALLTDDSLASPKSEEYKDRVCDYIYFDREMEPHENFNWKYWRDMSTTSNSSQAELDQVVAEFQDPLWETSHKDEVAISDINLFQRVEDGNELFVADISSELDAPQTEPSYKGKERVADEAIKYHTGDAMEKDLSAPVSSIKGNSIESQGSVAISSIGKIETNCPSHSGNLDKSTNSSQHFDVSQNQARLQLMVHNNERARSPAVEKTCPGVMANVQHDAKDRRTILTSADNEANKTAYSQCSSELNQMKQEKKIAALSRKRGEIRISQDRMSSVSNTKCNNDKSFSSNASRQRPTVDQANANGIRKIDLFGSSNADSGVEKYSRAGSRFEEEHNSLVEHYRELRRLNEEARNDIIMFHKQTSLSNDEAIKRSLRRSVKDTEQTMERRDLEIRRVRHELYRERLFMTKEGRTPKAAVRGNELGSDKEPVFAKSKVDSECGKANNDAPVQGFYRIQDRSKNRELVKTPTNDALNDSTRKNGKLDMELNENVEHDKNTTSRTKNTKVNMITYNFKTRHDASQQVNHAFPTKIGIENPPPRPAVKETSAVDLNYETQSSLCTHTNSGSGINVVDGVSSDCNGEKTGEKSDSSSKVWGKSMDNPSFYAQSSSESDASSTSLCQPNPHAVKSKEKENGWGDTDTSIDSHTIIGNEKISMERPRPHNIEIVGTVEATNLIAGFSNSQRSNHENGLKVRKSQSIFQAPVAKMIPQNMRARSIKTTSNATSHRIGPEARSMSATAAESGSVVSAIEVPSASVHNLYHTKALAEDKLTMPESASKEEQSNSVISKGVAKSSTNNDNGNQKDEILRTMSPNMTLFKNPPLTQGTISDRAAISGRSVKTQKGWEPIPKDQVSEHDWLLVDLCKRGLKWAEIRQRYNLRTGLQRAEKTLSIRYRRMHLTFPHIVPGPKSLIGGESRISGSNDDGQSEQSQNCMSNSGTATPSTAKTIEAVELPATLQCVGTSKNEDEGLIDKERIEQILLPSAIEITGPKDSESTEVSSSNDEDSEDSTIEEKESSLFENMDDAKRELYSPLVEEDMTHYTYVVERRVYHEDDIDTIDRQKHHGWRVVSREFVSPLQASAAAHRNMMREQEDSKDIAVWPLVEWHCIYDKGQSGLPWWTGKSRAGFVVQVRVKRSLYTWHHRKLPEGKEGWWPRILWDVWEERTETIIYEESELIVDDDDNTPVDEPCQEMGEVIEDYENVYNELVEGLDDAFSTSCDTRDTVDVDESAQELGKDSSSIEDSSSEEENDDGDDGGAVHLQQKSRFEHTMDVQKANTERSDGLQLDISSSSSNEQISEMEFSQTRVSGNEVKALTQQRQEQQEHQQRRMLKRMKVETVHKPIGGLHHILDRANRAAGAHVISLHKEFLKADPRRRRRIDELLKVQEIERQMEVKLDELEIDGGVLGEQVVTDKDIKMPPKYDYVGRMIAPAATMKVSIKVGVVQRGLESPRNF